MTPALGRRPLPPGDDEHIRKYPLRTLLPTVPTIVERTLKLNYDYRPKYDQGTEGACVGFASSWAMSILNRQFYDAQWLYRLAQANDEWPGENYDGTSVRAGMDMLKTYGHKVAWKGRNSPHDIRHGIESYHWARTVDEVRTAIDAGAPVVLGIDWYSSFDNPSIHRNESWIGRSTSIGQLRGGHAICCYGASDRREAVKLVNSWGSQFPTVWLGYKVLERLLAQGGEAAVITDRV